MSFLDLKESYTRRFVGKVKYPAEYVIRIFKGSYPNLNLNKDDFCNKSICDVGSGQGRHLLFLKDCGFKNVCGVEITTELADYSKKLLAENDILDVDVREGENSNIPFEDESFDYLLSWNACYYMNDDVDFKQHVREFNRVTKQGAKMIFSIPKKTCFIYSGSDVLKDGYRIIREDPFNIRNGSVFRVFENSQEIEDAFSKYFKNFIFASVHDDCFGYNYHWHLMYCERK